MNSPSARQPHVLATGINNSQSLPVDPTRTLVQSGLDMPIRWAEQNQQGPRNGDYTYSGYIDPGAEGRIVRYQYQRLEDVNAIRLIKLLPGDPDTEILASMIQVKRDFPDYRALSYVWGGEPPRETLKVYERSNWWLLNIHPIAHNALRHLRKRDSPVYIWVDSICINQQDNYERSAQVLRMGQTYTEASSVIVWLDPGTSDTSDNDNPIALITELLDISNFDRVVQEESNKKRWQALEDLLRNKWFTRLWVFQEVACAKRADLYWGKSSISWEDFADIIAALASRVDRFSNLQANAAFLNPGYAYRRLPAPTLVNICNSLFWKSGKGDIISRRYSLETLVSTLVQFESNDPRDSIYGLLALAKMDQPTRDFDLDYGKKFQDVYFDFVALCVKQSGSLDIICRHWAPIRNQKKANRLERPSDNLPSWVLTSLGSPFATYDDPNNNNRLYGDSLVGLPDRNWYNAALERPAEAQFSKVEHRNGTIRILQVVGIEIAKISAIGGHASKGIVQSEWLDMAGLPSQNVGLEASVSFDQLWRTLVADRDEEGNKAPRWYGRAFLECIQTPSQDMDIDTQKWINSSHTPTLVKDFLRRVQSVIWNRRFFTTDRGGVGLAPRQAKEGDSICILFGCSVPVLLRRHEVEEGPYYQLIGEAYLHEMMDGQAFWRKSEEEIMKDSKIFMIH